MNVAALVRSHAVFGALLASSVALAVACGDGATNPPRTPDSVVGVVGADGGVLPGPGTPAPPGSSPIPTAGVTPAPPTTAHSGVSTHGPMNAPVASQMAAELQALGLDPKALPPLDKLSGDKLRKVMRTFTKSLGAKCTDCHAEDFAAPTDAKIIAARMWNDFTRGYALEGGGALYCDSCHQGHMEFLDTSDKKALAKWMDTNFVGKLKRSDPKAGGAVGEMGCDNCHGDPFEGDIFKAMWIPQAKAKAAPKKAGK